MDELRIRIGEALDHIPFVDSHEHFADETTRLRNRTEFPSLLHYVDCDIASAGQGDHIGDGARRLADDRREAFLRWWPSVAHTGYGEAFRIMARDLWGVDDINRDTFDRLVENATAFPQPGFYQSLIRERAGIALACRIVWSGSPTFCDGELLFPVCQFDHFATVASRQDIRRIEAETRRNVHTLDDLVRALEASFDKRAAEGMVGVKIFLAYKRTLRFDQVAKSEAETIFNRATQAFGDTPVGFAEAKPLQDWMIHRIVEQATERKLPIQIHTGFQNDNGNYVEHARPSHLANLLMTWPRATFVLLHGGWPYTGEFTALAKVFSNVRADMAWTWIIGPHMAERLLGDLIDSVPTNKILGFGGDYNFAEGAYAHARMARGGIGAVLSSRIEEKRITEDEALAIARRVMHDNAADVYGFPRLD